MDNHNRRDSGPGHSTPLHPNPARRCGKPRPHGGPELGILKIANLAAGAQNSFPAKEIVDAGFLELVRYGIRKPDDPVIVDSLKVIDAVLKVDTPMGPVWHRYNHDGYGQRENGGPTPDGARAVRGRFSPGNGRTLSSLRDEM